MRGATVDRDHRRGAHHRGRGRPIMVVTITEGEDALAEDQELTDSLLAVFAECPGSMGS